MTDVTAARDAAPATPEYSARHIAELTVAFLRQAVDDEVLGRRLHRADTTVHLHLAEDVGITLRLDQVPIVVEPHVTGEAEIELWMTPELVVQCARGERKLQIAVMDGEVSYDGPVRKFMFILPVFRTFDHALWSRRSLG